YRRICGPLSNEKAIFLALNQLKDVIAKMSFGPDPGEALIGGDAQKFHSTYQWKMARTADMVLAQPNGAERKIGSKHSITGKRNKLGREGNSQVIEYDLYINGGIDWYSPLIRKLGKEYSKPISKNGGWYTWDVPNTEYFVTDENGKRIKEEGGGYKTAFIDTEKKFREPELAIIVANSTQAKELIRKEFEIPDLPPAEIIAEIEADNKKKRARKKLSADETDPLAPKDVL
ncbi:hypothetical protein, partial [Acinetobacter sp.]|uniref:hypothetical protein n=1 Tax=Acinetobacter sp. TaxID=472 RepID=UPI0037516AFF